MVWIKHRNSIVLMQSKVYSYSHSYSCYPLRSDHVVLRSHLYFNFLLTFFGRDFTQTLRRYCFNPSQSLFISAVVSVLDHVVSFALLRSYLWILGKFEATKFLLQCMSKTNEISKQMHMLTRGARAFWSIRPYAIPIFITFQPTWAVPFFACRSSNCANTSQNVDRVLEYC